MNVHENKQVTEFVSQADLARELGLSKAAISQALQGTGNLAQSTRQRILDHAKRRGYIPDPLLSSLSAFRRREKRPVFRGVIAAFLPGDFSSRDYYDYVGQLAKALPGQSALFGYRVEPMSVMAHDAPNPKRLGEALRARGVQGIIVVETVSDAFYQEFPWHYFPCVTVVRANNRLPLDLITQDAARACRLAFHECVARGYRRISVALHKGSDESAQHRSRHTLDGLRSDFPKVFAPGPFFISETLSKEQMKEWLHATQPDALIVHERMIPHLAMETSSLHPDQPAVAVLNLRDLGRGFAGVHLPLKEIANTAIHSIDQRVRHRITGISTHRQTILLEGEWVEGDSLPQR